MCVVMVMRPMAVAVTAGKRRHRYRDHKDNQQQLFHGRYYSQPRGGIYRASLAGTTLGNGGT
jgi:hypothetical protein